MYGMGYGSNFPYLQEEFCLPHVKLERNLASSYSWFSSLASSLTVPATPSGQPAGITIALVVRLSSMLGATYGQPNERIFSCGTASTNITLLVGRWGGGQLGSACNLLALLLLLFAL